MLNNIIEEGISVIMPTYNQAAFIPRAIKSLQNQSFRNWQLIIVNDGSTDNTKETLSRFLINDKIVYYENDTNIGLGASINLGITLAKFNFISYLPSDDIYYENHLKTLSALISKEHTCILAYSGINFHYGVSINSEGFSFSKGKILDYPLQLVQVLHRKNENNWMERKELVTEDLSLMYWSKLSEIGEFRPTNEITCEWVDHPDQRHKIIGEKLGGGLNRYRNYYNVKDPINFHSIGYNAINEEDLYKTYRRQVPGKKKLKILLVGDLAYNPERIFALEENGCELYGLWTHNPIYSMVGPIPFGNIKSLSPINWQAEIELIKPDIIYGLLNMMSVGIAHKVLVSNPDIPFVWHFKESPFFSRQNGQWKELCELITMSNGQIYSGNLMKEWFCDFLQLDGSPFLILDGDMPKQDMFMGNRSTLLSSEDGEIHTILAGRPIGIDPEDVGLLADRNIHFHFYGETFHTHWDSWVKKTKKIAGKYFHTHSNCLQNSWLKEFSRYDAGWLHHHRSSNGSDMMKVGWNDMNIPARFTTLSISGVPSIQKNNYGHLVETQTIVNQLNAGILFDNYDDLAFKLNDHEKMAEIRENIWRHRMSFTFDYHVKDLINFFQMIINTNK